MIWWIPEAPRVDVTLLDHPDLPLYGAGEAATAPVAAVIANAERALEEFVSGTPFSGGAHKVARGLVHQIRSVLDSPLGLRTDPELKSV